MFATGRIRPTGGSILRRVDVLHLEHTAADVKIALWIWNFDAGRAQMFVDQKIQIALEPPRPITHFHAPDHELEVDRAVTELVEENARRRIRKRGWMFAGRGNQRFAHTVDVAAMREADRNAKRKQRMDVTP